MKYHPLPAALAATLLFGMTSCPGDSGKETPPDTEGMEETIEEVTPDLTADEIDEAAKKAAEEIDEANADDALEALENEIDTDDE